MVKKKHKKLAYDRAEPIVIDGNSIAVGENQTIKLIAGRIPSDNQITITAHIFRAKKPGPTLLVMGGIHGDEINGIEVVNQLVLENEFMHLDAGTVIAIPLFNVFGFNNLSRDVPDGKDVNRSFPGSLRGSLASRIASTLTKKILPYIDYAVDCHTGGSSRYNHPQVRYSKKDLQAEMMARVFGATYTIEQNTIPNSFRRIATDMGIPTLVYEAGESIRLCGISIHKGKEGIKRIMDHLHIKKEQTEIKPLPETIVVRKTAWIRATQPGIFIWSKSSGHFVNKGEPIGVIKNPYGTKMITVFSRYNGHIIGHNNASVVHQGDALFHIGLVDKTHEGF